MNGYVKIGMMGDVMIGRTVNTVLEEQGMGYCWGDLLPLLHDSDLNLINLETTLTTSEEKVFKVFNFKATPDKVRTLGIAGITVANLANNHILDFSTQGLEETLRTLASANIRFVGAGMNEEEAARPVAVNPKGVNIGILGFTDNEPGWKAGPLTPGTSYIDISVKEDRMKATGAITRLRPEMDIVVVSIHWGPNLQAQPSSMFRSFAHEMIGAGADIIHGHSSHNFQGIEVFAGGIILYDAGDFIDDYVVHPDLRNDLSFFFSAEVKGRSVRKLRLTPVRIANCQVNKATGEDRSWAMERMKELSGSFGTIFDKEGNVEIREREQIHHT